MKVFIVLAACIVAVQAGGYESGYSSGVALAPARYGESGSSNQYRSEDNYGNYNFGYDEQHTTGGSSRREESNGGVRRGSYSLSDADGRRRTVNYVADHTGFHAQVYTNEPGVEPKDPASVLINKDGGAIYATAPVSSYAAPVASYAAGPVKASYAPNPARNYGPVAISQVAAPAYGASSAYGAGPAYGDEPAYAAAPRAFSYSFGAEHVAPIASYAAPAAYGTSAPIYQQRSGY